MNRRDFIRAAGTGVLSMRLAQNIIQNVYAGTTKRPAGIGMCDWNLGSSASPDAIPKAKEVNLQGIQVSVATSPDNVPLRDPGIREKYIELGKKHGIAFHSVAAGGILNRIPLASEPQSAVYVIDAVEAAKVLGAKNILIAFFGNGDLRVKDANDEFIKHEKNGFATYELDSKGVTRVVEVLKQIVPRAEDAGVALGLENTLSAAQNLEIIDRIGSPIVQIYYDVGNSWGNGYDVPGEIRLMGNDRICEVHLKDNKTPMLGSPEGQVNMSQCAEALAEIGYDKWLVLETSGRKDKFVEDTKTNVAFVKKTFNIA
ncbi:sugar phosphate isomerase/epimerase [candidate division KSB1 bacterium]|nr:sugar phosphate isomerase/epimerase [candidate division KSB1 bacterium]